MINKTELSGNIELFDSKIRQDNNIKKILNNKYILAWILKYTVKDFVDDSIDEICRAIEYSRKHNEATDKVLTLQQENIILGEGKVVFDMKVEVIPRGDSSRKIITDVEAQGTLVPQDKLLMRGIFYCSRLISSQKGTEFIGDEYDKLKRVYSIWICLGDKESYNISHEDDKEAMKLVYLLSSLLSTRLCPIEKEDILYNEYGISPTIDIKEVLDDMCTYSDMIYDEGKAEGKAEVITSVVDRFGISINEACKLAGLSINDYEKIMKSRMTRTRKSQLLDLLT